MRTGILLAPKDLCDRQQQYEALTGLNPPPRLRFPSAAAAAATTTTTINATATISAAETSPAKNRRTKDVKSLPQTRGHKFRVNVPRFVERNNKNDLQSQQPQRYDADSLSQRRHVGSAFEPDSPESYQDRMQERPRRSNDDYSPTIEPGSQWSVLTPLEYKTVLSEESSWQVTISTDFERLFPTVVSAGTFDDAAPSRSNSRGRPPKPGDRDSIESRRFSSSLRELELYHDPYSTLADLTLDNLHLSRQPASPNDAVGAFPWTLFQGPTGISINLHIESAGDMCGVIESLVRYLSAGHSDIPTTADTQPHPILVVNKDLLGKYGSRTYSYGEPASTSLPSPKTESTDSDDSRALTRNLGIFVGLILGHYQSSLSYDHAMLALVGGVVGQFLECGNVFHPFVHRGTFLSWFCNLKRPLDHPMVMAIAAGILFNCLYFSFFPFPFLNFIIIYFQS